MTPAARIQAAITILDDILAGSPAEKCLTRWARASRFAGSKDRAAIRDHVFDALRCRRSYAALGGSETGRGLMLGAARSDGGDFSLFTGEGYGPAAIGENELPEIDFADLSDAVSSDLPDWIWELFQSSLGSSAKGTAQALRHRADVFMRVNLLKASVEDARQALQSEGIETEAHGLSPTALKVLTYANKVARSAAYLDGLVELQDAASQAVCDFLEWPDGGTVLDYCAGGGGKTLALAARQTGTFTAHDANPLRMKDLPARAKRAGTRVEVLENIPSGRTFDLVLCDVPCSGSGSWRRSPEGKWRLSENAFSSLIGTQASILDKAKDLVAEGGELAYATCSVLQPENRDQIDAFLARNPEWTCLTDRQFLPDEGGDGFYAARLTRL